VLNISFRSISYWFLDTVLSHLLRRRRKQVHLLRIVIVSKGYNASFLIALLLLLLHNILVIIHWDSEISIIGSCWLIYLIKILLLFHVLN